MSYRDYAPPAPLLFGYDPERDLPEDHLARLVERVVEESVRPGLLPARRGQPPFDPRLCAKVLLYGYATGVRSSRQLERLCTESLPYLYLTRGDTPSYRTLCSFRVHRSETLESVWTGLFAVAQEVGIERLGRIVVDGSKIKADASPDSVVSAREFDAVLSQLRAILKQAKEADDRDDEGPPGTNRLGKQVDGAQMRDILRRVRSRARKPDTDADAPETSAKQSSDALPVTARMRQRVTQAVETLEAASQEELKHVNLTDPDARMMCEGRDKHIRDCHNFEVAVDNGLLVVAQTSNSAHDAHRLEPLVEAAEKTEPAGIVAIDADAGYYTGDTVASLIKRNIDVCIPNSNTACDLHRAQPIGTTRRKITGTVSFTYDETTNSYHCPQGNELVFSQRRQDGAQQVNVYRARRACTGCPLAEQCGNKKNRVYRRLNLGVDHELLDAHLDRFRDPEHVARYHRRGPAVETVFGFLRAVLGFRRWMVRGSERVAAETRAIKTALQLRKIYSRWAGCQG